MNNERKAAPWFVSILIHAGIGLLIIGAGVKYLVPQGEVSTGEGINIDTFSGPIGVQTETKTDSQDVAIKEKPKAATVLPPKTVTTQYEDAPEIPQEEPTEPALIPPPPPEETAAEPELTEPESPVSVPIAEDPQELAQDDPPPAPVEAEAPAPTGEASGIVENPENQSAPTEPPPKFGTPGTTIEEAKLAEKPGNKRFNYPWMARIKKHEGTVVLGAYVQKDGHISHAQILKSSGHPDLDKEALETYLRWRFNPGTSGWVVKPVNFRLRN